MDEENLYKAITLIKAGEKQEGGRLLKEILEEDPENERAWFWMSVCVRKTEQKEYCLNKVLEINPKNEEARQALNKVKLDTLEVSPSRKSKKPGKPFSPKRLAAYLAGGFILVCCGCFGLMELTGSDDVSAVSDNSQNFSETPNPSTATANAMLTQLSLNATVAHQSYLTMTATNLLVPTLTLTPIPIPGSFSCVPQNTQRDQAELIRVIDGDTIEVRIDGQTYDVRYIGMDTPENGDPYFAESAEYNQQLLEGETLLLVKDMSETDQYDRLLRYVFAGDTFVNWQLVQDGYAQVATYPPDVACIEFFLEAQTAANNLNIGLWALALVPTATTEPTSSSSNVEISFILYDGAVKQVESDEYAVITNNGSSPVNLNGWRLNAGNPGQNFNFPNYELGPGQSCRVYTNEIHSETCGFSFGNGQALWNNGGDCGYLYNAQDVEVDSYCY